MALHADDFKLFAVIKIPEDSDLATSKTLGHSAWLTGLINGYCSLVLKFS